MIIDKVENLRTYAKLNPLIADVLAFLAQHDLNSLSNGTHPIRGETLFVNIEDDKGKNQAEAVTEYHRKMIDIQLPLNMAETYGYTPVAELPEAEFDAERDIAKVPNVPPRQFITAKPGEFIIFFPQDGHAPCIAKGTIHKAIFKVAVDGK